MPRLDEIPQFTRPAHYATDVPWDHLERHIENWGDRGNTPLILDPDFQREHVWTRKQQREFIEFILKGGESSKDVYWNCKGWMNSFEGPMYLVDGKQRIQAVRLFLNDKIKVFGHKWSEYEDKLRVSQHTFKFHVNNLETKAEVIQWYLDLNFGGTPHTNDERKRVEKILKGLKKEN